MSDRIEATYRRGCRWRLRQPAGWSGLEAIIDAFPRVQELPGAETLKSNRSRTVVRWRSRRDDGADATPSTDWLIKVYRYGSRWDRLRFHLLAHRALQEFRALLRLEQEGFSVPPVRGLGEAPASGVPKEAALLVEFLDGHVDLAEWLRRALESPLHQEADPGSKVREVARLVRRLHDAGVWHRDLHSGNILVGPSGVLLLIDVHSCIFLPRLPRFLRRRGVVQLLHSIRWALTPAQRQRFAQDYGVDALTLRGGGASALALRLERSLLRREATRLRSRSKRCLKPSSEFDAAPGRGYRWWWRRAYDEADLRVALGLSPTSSATDRPGGRTSHTLASGEPLEIEVRRSSSFQLLGGREGARLCRRRYRAAHALDVRGLPVARGVALWERRRLGRVVEAALATETSAGWVRLDRLLSAEDSSGPSSIPLAHRRRLVRDCGRLLRRLHASGCRLRAPLAEALWTWPGSPAPLSPAGNLQEALRLDPTAVSFGRVRRRARVRDLVGAAAFWIGHVDAGALLRGLCDYARQRSETSPPRVLWSELRAPLLRSLRNVVDGGHRGGMGR